MARAVDQFRSGDVTVWGIVALATWAVAILGANISGIIPPGVYAALHASRLEGSTINQLRSQVASLEEETVRLQRETNQLMQRLTIGEEAASAVTRRVGALEVSVPRLVGETRRAAAAAIDPMPTGAIGPGKTLTFEAEGGMVAVQQKPLAPDSDEVKLKVVPLAGTMPKPLAEAAAPGVALGFPVTSDTAQARWEEILAQAGTMLVGLSPVLSEQDGVNGKLLIAGPLTDKASAIELCARMDQVGIPCEAADYTGQPLPLLN